MEQQYFYEVIWGTSTSDLSEKVNQQLKFGWELVGGVSGGERNVDVKDKRLLYQAMIKKF